MSWLKNFIKLRNNNLKNLLNKIKTNPITPTPTTEAPSNLNDYMKLLKSLNINVSDKAITKLGDTNLQDAFINDALLKNMGIVANTLRDRMKNDAAEAKKLQQKINDSKNQLGIYNVETDLIYAASEIKKTRLQQLKILLVVFIIIFFLVILQRVLKKKSVSYSSPVPTPTTV